jgi:hypothetical protein
VTTTFVECEWSMGSGKHHDSSFMFDPSNECSGQYDPSMDRWSVQLAPQLRALVALAVHNGHMTQAAAELGIPQSSMSRRINALQATLRVPLLIHDGRTVRLTAEANRLASRARGPLDDLDRLLAEITGGADPDCGTGASVSH